MKVESSFDLGDMVNLKHDNDKIKRMVTGFSFRGIFSYCLSCGEKETWHYEYEIEMYNSESKKVGFK